MTKKIYERPLFKLILFTDDILMSSGEMSPLGGENAGFYDDFNLPT